MKNNFSSSINESLAGRSKNETFNDDLTNKTTTHSQDKPNNNLEKKSDSTIIETDQKGKQDKGLGKNIDGSFKQSKAGRRIKSKAQKKVQLPLTLTPTTKNILDEWASTKPRSAANYLSEYVEGHLNDIIEYFNK